MDDRSQEIVMSYGISNVALECIMGFIEDSHHRSAVSLVCRRWYNVDSLTRKHITVALCYCIASARLRRFPYIESLKLKGKPRASMYNLIPHDWGGHAGPWVNEISVGFHCLKSIHFRRMIVKDHDLGVLARARGHTLQVLKLDVCSGFSTDGLLQVAKSCRCLRTLFLEDSSIIERDGNWLHELALNNAHLETLSFHMTEMKLINITDLELIARNCPSLVCVKISDCETLELAGFFRVATALEEFGGGYFSCQKGEALDQCSSVSFPPRLCRLGLNYMGKTEMPMIFPCTLLLKKLDLRFALLDTEDHCQLIRRCPNLEALEARDVIGDSGLEVVAQNCKRLRRIRVERGEDEGGLEDERGVVSHRGISLLAQGCQELEYLTMYVSDIANAALESIGTFSRNLRDFRLCLLDREKNVTELPLDVGVRALLMGCKKLEKFALYLRIGGLSDVGFGYIGRYGTNIRWMLLGRAGQTDSGLLELSRGCPSLQSLELRCCCFSGQALALAAMQLDSLRYLWLQGSNVSEMDSNLMAMIHPFWNVEFIPMSQIASLTRAGTMELPAQIIAYRSISGPRTDCPEYVVLSSHNSSSNAPDCAIQ